MRLHSALLILALVGLTSGCVLGPGTGIRDRFDYSAAVADYALLERMRRVQLSGGIGMRVRRLESDEAGLMTFRQKVDPAILGLDPGAREFRVGYGSVASDKEIAILTRSALEILVDLSSFITVPEEHIAERRVSPTAAAEEGPAGPVRPLIQIKSSRDRPADAFVAVSYRDFWFWIDDRDVPSKRMFSFIMFVFALVEPGSKDAPPVLTIPTG